MSPCAVSEQICLRACRKIQIRERENARFDEARASVADGNGARFDGSRGVVDGVVVVRDVVVPEHARGLQRAGTTITEKPLKGKSLLCYKVRCAHYIALHAQFQRNSSKHLRAYPCNSMYPSH